MVSKWIFLEVQVNIKAKLGTKMVLFRRSRYRKYFVINHTFDKVLPPFSITFNDCEIECNIWWTLRNQSFEFFWILVKLCPSLISSNTFPVESSVPIRKQKLLKIKCTGSSWQGYRGDPYRSKCSSQKLFEIWFYIIWRSVQVTFVKI